MINYINLPLLIDNNKFNYIFSEYIQDYPNALKIPIQIESNYGAFPYSLWNGGNNSNYGKNFLYPELITFPSNVNAPIRINFSNIILTEQDIFNNHENTILKLYESNGTLIEVADLKLYNYINTNYSNYQFILSDNANLIHPFDEDIINLFLERDDFILITLPFNNKLDLTKIKRKSKLEAIIGNECEKCPILTQQQCKITEINYQYNFSSMSCANCTHKTNFYDESDKLLNEILEYNLQGINHFKISAPDINKIKLFNKFIIANFIKPEFVLECNNYILKNAGEII